MLLFKPQFTHLCNGHTAGPLWNSSDMVVWTVRFKVTELCPVLVLLAVCSWAFSEPPSPHPWGGGLDPGTLNSPRPLCMDSNWLGAEASEVIPLPLHPPLQGPKAAIIPESFRLPGPAPQLMPMSGLARGSQTPLRWMNLLASRLSQPGKSTSSECQAS